MNLFFNSAASDPASALARSQTNNQPALKPTFVLGDNPEINIYVTSGDGGFDPASGDATVTPSLGIGTPGAGPSGGTFWLGVSTATSGSLTTAKRYQIETYVAGDDFANLGAAENATGVVFTSSGTTPTDWTNGSTLIEITTDISYSASAATLEAALEATEAVVGVTITKASAAPNFVVEWDSVGAVALLVGGPSSLTPASAVVTSELQAGSASAVERQIVRLTRQPYALQTVWSTITDGWSARLDCNTRGLLDFLGGSISAGSTLEFQLVDSSQNVRTVGQIDCIIRNEAIDEASTIPTPFPSYLTATQVGQNFLQNRFQITSLDGGGGTALDGIPTGPTANPTVPTDALVAIELGGSLSFYELVAGTDAESLPDVVRPDDYAASTNERVWLLRAVPSALPLHASTHEDGGTDEINVAGLSGLLADGQTALAHASTHENGGADEISVAGLSGLLADGQTPLTHASTHEDGGTDEVTLAQSQVTGLTSDLAAKLPLAGGTMTGQLNFSGTTHAGIKLLSLTTTQRDALTAANGMLIYNTTTAKVQKYEAGAWVNNGSPDAHASTHQNNGADEISVAGLSGLLADGQTPLAHASTHASAGSDPLTLAQSQVTSPTTDLAAKLAVAGGTMTGQLNFSGTTHAGIKLLSLTTTQRNALTPANGMIIYNTTTARCEQYTASGWVVVGSANALSLFSENTSSPVAAYATGTNAVAIGNAAVASRFNELNLLACVKYVSSDIRSTVFAFNGETTNATQTTLFLNGVSQKLTLGDNSAVFFSATFVGRRTDIPGEVVVIKCSGAAAKDATASSSKIVGSLNQDNSWITTSAQIEASSIKLRVVNNMASGADFKFNKGSVYSAVHQTVASGASGTFCLAGAGVYSCFIDIGGGGGVVWDGFATLVAGLQYVITLTSSNDPRIGGFVVPTYPTEAATITCASGDLSSWAVTIEADTSAGGLAPKVTGEAGKSIDWICIIKLDELYV
jgi:hypothetical protein